MKNNPKIYVRSQKNHTLLDQFYMNLMPYSHYGRIVLDWGKKDPFYVNFWTSLDTPSWHSSAPLAKVRKLWNVSLKMLMHCNISTFWKGNGCVRICRKMYFNKKVEPLWVCDCMNFWSDYHFIVKNWTCNLLPFLNILIWQIYSFRFDLLCRAWNTNCEGHSFQGYYILMNAWKYRGGHQGHIRASEAMASSYFKPAI